MLAFSKDTVSGVAMGLIRTARLLFLPISRVLEDFLGDMDFKVCSTIGPITAMQMDKATGLTQRFCAAFFESRAVCSFEQDARTDSCLVLRPKRPLL